jgi:hypothetical protein
MTAMIALATPAMSPTLRPPDPDPEPEELDVVSEVGVVDGSFGDVIVAASAPAVD